MTPGQQRYLYVVGCVGVQAVKIGVATDCASRLSGLQTGCPLPLAMLWRQAAPNAFAAENALHGRFSAQRVRGEWFDLGLDPVPVVKAALAEVIKELPELDEDLSPAEKAAAGVAVELGEVLKAWPENMERVTTHELATLLAWETPVLNERMRHIGCPPIPLRISGKVVRGYDRTVILSAQPGRDGALSYAEEM